MSETKQAETRACEFRGCLFPALYCYRDINADVAVCQQHAQFLGEENDYRDHERPILDTFHELTTQPFRVVVSSETGRTLNGDLTIQSRRGWSFGKSHRYSSRIVRTYAEIMARRRSMARERENRDLSYKAEVELRKTQRKQFREETYRRWAPLVEQMRREREAVHKATQRERWQVMRAGGIWVAKRQPKYETERTKLWNQLTNQFQGDAGILITR